MSEPTAAVVAAVEPEIALNTAAVPSAVNGRLPRMLPAIVVTHATSRRDTPPRPMSSPANRKNGTASSAYLSSAWNIT